VDDLVDRHRVVVLGAEHLHAHGEELGAALVDVEASA